MKGEKTYFLLEPLVPFCHLSSSSASSLAACCAAFWSAASALRAMPAARLVLSLFLVLPMASRGMEYRSWWMQARWEYHCIGSRFSCGGRFRVTFDRGGCDGVAWVGCWTYVVIDPLVSLH